MTDIVHYAFSEHTAVIHMDDGKVNMVSHTLLEQLGAALDRAEADGARAIALIGRPGKFSAGFDLGEIQKGPEQAAALVTAGGKMALRLFKLPVSLVMGVSGHAIAMGAIFAMTADEAFVAEGNFKIGLNEVSIGMALPEFATLLATERLARPYLYRATSHAELYNPDDAVAVGYADHAVPAEQLEEQTIARARQLAATLEPSALKVTKARMRGDCMRKLEKSLEQAISLTG